VQKAPQIVKKIPQSERNPSDPPKPIFEFTWSDQYNLTRVSPEEAAERLQKIQEKRNRIGGFNLPNGESKKEC
jgi:hypothetical protein